MPYIDGFQLSVRILEIDRFRLTEHPNLMIKIGVIVIT